MAGQVVEMAHELVSRLEGLPALTRRRQICSVGTLDDELDLSILPLKLAAGAIQAIIFLDGLPCLHIIY